MEGLAVGVLFVSMYVRIGFLFVRVVVEGFELGLDRLILR